MDIFTGKLIDYVFGTSSISVTYATLNQQLWKGCCLS